MEVIGETVVAISGRVSASLAVSVPEPDEQAAKESMRAAPRIPYRVFNMAESYYIFELLQMIRSCRICANECSSGAQRAKAE